MTTANLETTEALKAMILDMNECQLRFALLMILNGADLPYAIDHATAIWKEVTR